MEHLLKQLRVGEKIGLCFGLVGLLYLAVIWNYHGTLARSLGDYRQLIEVHDARKDILLGIQSGILDARRAEKNFLLQRDEAFVAEWSDRVDAVAARTVALDRIGEAPAKTGGELAALMETYRQRFMAIADAWRIKGLDHDSGLQGAFREAVHELEDRAGNFKVSSLYLHLLQIRRREKDLGLRRDEAYRSQVFTLLAGLRQEVGRSGLEPEVKASLGDEIAAYEASFREYGQRVLAMEDIQGGKGPFRQAAHRIEAILQEHYIPDMESNILQLRRREKDYLLRDDKQYVDMALLEWQRIADQVAASGVSDQDKAGLNLLLDQYRRDFLALVEQNDAIDVLSQEMRLAIGQIEPIVTSRVDAANRLEADMTARIDASSRASERIMLWIVVAATMLGILFCVVITLRITRPMRRMMGLLHRIAEEDPTERIAISLNSRDEIDLMAQSVNAIADHKAGLVKWWRQEHG